MFNTSLIMLLKYYKYLYLVYKLLSYSTHRNLYTITKAFMALTLKYPTLPLKIKDFGRSYGLVDRE